jgi:hypothetical protein
MKTLFATLFAAMVLLVSAGVAGATGPTRNAQPFGPFRGGNVLVPASPRATAGANTSTGNSGTEWYVYLLAGLGGIVVVGGTAYAVYTAAHRHGPHYPVGAH